MKTKKPTRSATTKKRKKTSKKKSPRPNKSTKAILAKSPLQKSISLYGVRQNNLKNISIQIPLRKLSVITGLSGSGKSSLAFDTLYAEGQRRYIESLSTYTRQFLEKMPKPDLDKIENIPPTIALEQRNTVQNSRSTVGTQTELSDYLRILFSKIGTTYCLNCNNPVQDVTHDFILTKSLEWLPEKKVLLLAQLEPSEQKSKKQTEKILLSLFKILQAQGYRRLLWEKTEKRKTEYTQLDLDDFGSPHFPKISIEDYLEKKLWIVVDRFNVKKNQTNEIRSRLDESIQHALQMGKNEINFFDYEKNKFLNFKIGFHCCNITYPYPDPQLFSFNSPTGACSHCNGFGHTLEYDEQKVVPDQTKTLKNGAIDPLSKPSAEESQNSFFRFCERNGISIGKRFQQLSQNQKKLIWEGSPHDKTFPGITGFFKILEKKKYKIHVRVFLRRYQSPQLCPECHGARLNKFALAMKINDQNFSDLHNLSILESQKWFEGLASTLQPSQRQTIEEPLQQIQKRLYFLRAVGVEYLTLSRLTKTLSGGEFQRINLAAQLGHGLCGTLYVLDEPSIGLHASDTEKLIHVLNSLRDQGNTVVLVEHDLDVMRAADWLIELGPGSGRRGGEVIASAPQNEFINEKGSVTAKYLSGAFELNRTRIEKDPPKKWLRITGCKENNLKNISIRFPLERLVIVTGVSGSGKSTLVHKTLYPALKSLKSTEQGGAFDKLFGAEQISEVVLLDQKPIGKSSRSNPATYLKAWDEVRRIFANQVLSLRRGYTPQYFSFNVEGGRCPVCRGEGEITLDMHFMADVKIPCEECNGKRFKKDVLNVSYREKNISQILETTIDEAFDLFRDNSVLVKKLGILREVGLGYLQLGQSASTLSGGESQRLKIASVLDQQVFAMRALYIFDEPTTGLHQEDIRKLMDVIFDLIDQKHSVIMIEHHLDVIKQADWVIDLGPGGGENGGELIAEGTPQGISQNKKSCTGKLLQRYF